MVYRTREPEKVTVVEEAKVGDFTVQVFLDLEDGEAFYRILDATGQLVVYETVEDGKDYPMDAAQVGQDMIDKRNHNRFG